jgi:hypothetical protein
MPPPQGMDIAVILTLIFAASLGMVGGILLLMSRLTGWKRLADTYPAQPPAPNARRVFGSAGFRALGGYNNCVIWRADEEHLHIALMRPFQWMGHPPMSIPWAAVQFDPAQPRWGYKRLSVDGIPIRAPAKVVETELALREALARENIQPPAQHARA